MKEEKEKSIEEQIEEMFEIEDLPDDNWWEPKPKSMLGRFINWMLRGKR